MKNETVAKDQRDMETYTSVMQTPIQNTINNKDNFMGSLYKDKTSASNQEGKGEKDG